MKRVHIKRFTLLTVLSLTICNIALASDDLVPDYYLSENEKRYDAFIAENLDLPVDTAIAYVNAAADIESYADISIVDNPADTLVLCNKNNALPSDYVPNKLVSVGDNHKLRNDAAEHFLRMKADASKVGLRLVVYSAYRSYTSQSSIYNSYMKSNSQSYVDSFSARPGHSEHQTGLAVDILHKPGSSGFRSAAFQKTPEFTWLRQNAHKYGFILRYPDGLSDITGYTFEPWHWRFIGVHAATVMYDNNISTFEEYFGRFLAPDLSNHDDSIALPFYFSLIVNDTASVLESYYIKGDYFFKLRDLASLSCDSYFRFDVSWDKKTASVELVKNKPYSNGNFYDFVHRGTPEKFSPGAEIVSQSIPLDFTVYNIAGNSYVDLFDLSDLLGFSLSWDGCADTIFIE